MPDGSNEIIINKSLDQILESLPLGSVQRAIANNLYGINYRKTGNAVPKVKDSYGYTFFTRPQLNMSTLNLSNYRGFYNLLSQNKNSYQRYTRCVLDPRLGRGTNQITSPFVDPSNPFIATLTNNLVSISGWPDLTVPTYTSEAGIYGQEHTFVDGVTNHLEAFDIDAVFKNSKGNPLLYMFYVWIKYESLVFDGILNPYIDMISENEIDYNTRIYRLVMDQTRRYVTQIGCTGASFPVNVPTGNLFDYNTDTPYNTKNNELNIRFRSMGFLAFEDIIKMYFNQTSAIFNADMRNLLNYDMSGGGDSVYRESTTTIYSVPGTNSVKIPYLISLASDINGIDNRLLSVNHKALPYINLYTNELEWWISRDYFTDDMLVSYNSEMSRLGQNSSSVYDNTEEYEVEQ